MPTINLGNVVGLIKSQTAPSKKYVLWGYILNPVLPDLVELRYWDQTAGAWVALTDPTHQYWLKPVIDNTITSPPVTPAENDRYLIPAGGTGAWAGKDDQVATFKSGSWVYTIPLDGYIVSVRTQANKLYDYRGIYGSGGAWFENDFQVPIAPGTYIPSTEKGMPLGVATLDSSGKLPVGQIEGSTLPYTPANPPSWPGTTTIWGALDYVRTLAGGGGVPNLDAVLTTGNNANGKGITNLLHLTNNGLQATRVTVDGTWTAIATNEHHWRFAGTFTLNGAASVLRAYKFEPTIVYGTGGQSASAVYINPTFSDAFSNPSERYSLRTENGAIQFNIAQRNALSINHSNASSTSTNLIDFAFYVQTTTAGSNVNQIALVAPNIAGSAFNRFHYVASSGGVQSLTFFSGLGTTTPVMHLNSVGGVGLGTTIMSGSTRLTALGVSGGNIFEFFDNTGVSIRLRLDDAGRLYMGIPSGATFQAAIRNSTSSTNILELRNSADNNRWAIADGGTITHSVLGGIQMTIGSIISESLSIGVSATIMHNIVANVTAAAGAVNTSMLKFGGTINTSGSHLGGVIMGIEYNPVMTNDVGLTHYFIKSAAGSVLIGNAAGDTLTSLTRVDIRGISAGNALRVASEANVALFNITSGGVFTLSNSGGATILTVSTSSTPVFQLAGTATGWSGMNNNGQDANTGIFGISYRAAGQTAGSENAYHYFKYSGAAFNSWSAQYKLLKLANLAAGGSTIQPSTGTGGWTNIEITPTYNITGTVSASFVYGIDYNPTVTSMVGTTHYAWRSTSGAFYAKHDNLGVTSSDLTGMWIANTTAAILNNQQISPSFVWEGQGWKTDSGGASQSIKFATYVLPVQGTANPSGLWTLRTSINGGAYTDIFMVNSNVSAQLNGLLYIASPNGLQMPQGGGTAFTVLTHNSSNVLSLASAGTSNYSAGGNASDRHNFTGGWTKSTGSEVLTFVSAKPTLNFTGGTCTSIAFDYVPTVTNTTGLTEIAYRSTRGQVFFANSSSDTIVANTRVDIRGISGGQALRVARSDNSTGLFGVSDTGIIFMQNSSIAFTTGANTLLSHSIAGTMSGSGTTLNAKLVSGTISASSGSTLELTILALRPTYNFTASVTSSFVYGIDYNPVLSNMVGITHIAIRAVTGQVLIGNHTVSSYKVSVKSDTNDNTTSIYQGQNSSNVTYFNVRSDGFASLGTTINGNFNVALGVAVGIVGTSSASLYYRADSNGSDLKTWVSLVTNTGSWLLRHLSDAYATITTPLEITPGTSGGVGIGVAPTYKLHVRGTAADQNLFVVEENGGTKAIEVIEAAGVKKIGFFNVAPVAQQTMGAATAGGTYTAAEQAMLQKVYDLTRAFGLGT